MKSSIVKGDFKTLLRISLPLIFFLLCEALTSFVEQIFLSYYSSEAVHASLNAGYLASVFQLPIMIIATMAQVFVGIYQGRGEYKKIGPCVWQLIWFSLFSSSITLPLGFVASTFYFKNTVIHAAGTQYFTVMALGNFLFPLTTALTSFYLGRGKTLVVTLTMLASYGLNLCLSWILIFGYKGMIPPLGLVGAALAKCVSLIAICTVFFIGFIKVENHLLYGTRNWKFCPLKLWEYMKPGMVRSFGLLSIRGSWAAIVYIVLKKGGRYLDVLTIGGAIIAFLVFIGMGLYRATLTIASNLIGAKQYAEIWNLCRSFALFIFGIAILLAIPLLLFPNSLLYFFDSSMQEIYLKIFPKMNFWIWIYMIAIIMQSCFCALLIAFRDLKFQFLCYLCLWPISFFPVYYGLCKGHWQPDKLWLILAFENAMFMVCFFVRLRQKQREEYSLALL